MHKTSNTIFAIMVITLMLTFNAYAQVTLESAQLVIDVYHNTGLPSGLTTIKKAELKKIVSLLDKRDISGARAAWGKFCKGYIVRSTPNSSIKQMQQWILKKAFLKSGTALETALRDFEKQKTPLGLSDTKDGMRSELLKLFEHFDQKANQLYNMLYTISKDMDEMTSAVTRNAN